MMDMKSIDQTQRSIDFGGPADITYRTRLYGFTETMLSNCIFSESIPIIGENGCMNPIAKERHIPKAIRRRLVLKTLRCWRGLCSVRITPLLKGG